MTMFLHARSLQFYHPRKEIDIEIKAPLQPEFEAMLKTLKFDINLTEL